MTGNQSQDMYLYSQGRNHMELKEATTVTLSSMEAKYMALSNAIQENIRIWQLFTELGKQADSPTPIFIDNHGTIEYMTSTGFHAC